MIRAGETINKQEGLLASKGPPATALEPEKLVGKEEARELPGSEIVAGRVARIAGARDNSHSKRNVPRTADSQISPFA